MNPPDPKPSLTTAQAIYLLRNGKLDSLPETTRHDLRDLLERQPAILALSGCQDALAELESARTGPLAAESPPGADEASAAPASVRPRPSAGSRRPMLTVTLGIAIAAAAGTCIVVFRDQSAPLSGPRDTKRNVPDTPHRSESDSAEPSQRLPAVAPRPPISDRGGNVGRPPSGNPRVPPVKKPPAQVGDPKIRIRGGGSPPLTLPPALAEAMNLDLPEAGPPAPDVRAPNPDPIPSVTITGEGARLLPDPAGGFQLTDLNGQSKIVLTGETSRLAVGAINGEATLDLTGLSADHLDFRGPINGNTRITLSAPNARVDFHRPVEGSAVVTIDAPNGLVAFHSGDQDGALVTGGAQLRISAKSTDLAAGLDGGARVDVTLTPEGTLHHGPLRGGSTLTYRQIPPPGANPAITGDTSGSGRLVAE